MHDIVTLTLHPANLPYTIFLIVIILYWITVVLGVLDFDFLDIDIDVDPDIDVDVDVDSDIAVGGGGLSGILSFLHIGQIPFMLYLSVLAIVLWTTAMFVSAYFNPDSAYHFIIWVVPILLTGLFLTKGLTYPFKQVHGKLNEKATSTRDLVGKQCRIVTIVRPESYGQAEVTYDSQHLLLTVFTEEKEAISKNTPALIVGYDTEREAYEVSPFI
ncbi:MAG: hypothetical protein AB8F95_00310 [Bacteroidia bacterium]